MTLKVSWLGFKWVKRSLVLEAKGVSVSRSRRLEASCVNSELIE